MDDKLHEDRHLFMEKTTCEHCGTDVIIELFLSRRDELLSAWQEGVCLNCGEMLLNPLPEAVIMIGESTRQAMQN